MYGIAPARHRANRANTGDRADIETSVPPGQKVARKVDQHESGEQSSNHAHAPSFSASAMLFSILSRTGLGSQQKSQWIR